MDDSFPIFLVVVAPIAVALWGGCNTGRNLAQLEAAKYGAGEYFIDTNHNRQFRWKTNGLPQ